MKKIGLSALTRTLGWVGFTPCRRTVNTQLLQLIRSLRPRRTILPLIRLGPNGDGGYVVPDDLLDLEACFSPGVSTESGFEKDCANLGMQVFLADKSVDGPAERHERFHFTKKFVGAVRNDDFMTLDDWVAASVANSSSDLLLQIDIEGYEYETLLAATDDLLERFRIIVIEFHRLDAMLSDAFFSVASRAFEKLLRTHACVHLHPNNCCGVVVSGGVEIPRAMEMTFLRLDRGLSCGYADSFPNPLDHDNTANPPIILPRCWQQGQ